LKCGFPACDFECRRYETLDVHVYRQHDCEHCGYSFPDLRFHACPDFGQRGGHVGPPDINQSFFKETKRSHRGVIIEYTYTVDDTIFLFDDMYQFFEHVHDPLSRLLRENINFFHGITVTYRQFTTLYNKKDRVEEDKYLGTNAITIRHPNFIDSSIHFIIVYILKELEYWNSNGSGYDLRAIKNAIITIGQYKPVRARGYIPTPEALKYRQGLLNIKGRDGLCFKYCIAANFFKDEIEKVHTLRFVN
jgi:hypothetical protein